MVAKGRSVVRFRGNKNTDKGNVGIMAALSLPVALLVVGGAIDYGRAYNAKITAARAADAALLSGVRAAIDYRKKKLDGQGWREAGINAATAIFNANLKLPNDASASAPIVDVQMNGKNFVATIDYSVDVRFYILNLVGMGAVSMPAHAASGGSGVTYTRVNFIVDTSPSMGVGATADDQQVMQSATGCSFACHYNATYGARDNFAAARASGALLRIDVAKAAIIKIIQQLKAKQVAAQQFEVGIYEAGNSLVTVERGTTDLDAAVSKAQSLDLTGSAGQGGTNMHEVMQEVAATTPNGGDGGNPDARLTYSVLLTDGVENSLIFRETSTPDLFSYEHDVNFSDHQPQRVEDGIVTMQGFAGESCQVAKDAKHNVITFELEYIIPPADASNARMVFVHDEILPTLKYNFDTCASASNLSFSANSPSDIMTAAGVIGDQILRDEIRLTE